MVDKQAQQHFCDHAVELLQGLGPVSARRMFGGHGLFLDGLMFALIADNELYLKADAECREVFVELGLQPFTYYKQGKPMALSYYQAPDSCLDSLDEMTRWGNVAFAAAVRASRGNKPRASTPVKRQ
ncbi:MAG: TfoX/Sxy family protein [Pseudohongiellaceae bacterium]